MIDALRPVYRLKELLQLFRISKSSYFYCVHAAQKDKYKELLGKSGESSKKMHLAMGIAGFILV